jgi:hypothetical protein
MKTLLFIVFLGFTGSAFADDSEQTKMLLATIQAQNQEIAKLNLLVNNVTQKHTEVVAKYKRCSELGLEWKALALELQSKLDAFKAKPASSSPVFVTPMAPGSYLVRDAGGKSQIVTEGVPGVFTTR